MKSLNETILTRDLSNNTALKDSKHIINLLEILDKIENLIKPDKIRKFIDPKPIFGSDNRRVTVTYQFNEDRYAEKKEYVAILKEVKKIFDNYFKNDPSVQIVLNRNSRFDDYSVRASFGKGNGSIILSAEKVAYTPTYNTPAYSTKKYDETEVRTAFLLYAFIPSRMLSSFKASAKGFEMI